MDLEYVLYDLHPKVKRRAIGEGKSRVKMNEVEKTLIDFPVDGKGELDSQRQKVIAGNRRKAYSVRDGILASIEDLTEVAVEV